jgi:hypothetical protein
MALDSIEKPKRKRKAPEAVSLPPLPEMPAHEEAPAKPIRKPRAKTAKLRASKTERVRAPEPHIAADVPPAGDLHEPEHEPHIEAEATPVADDHAEAHGQVHEDDREDDHEAAHQPAHETHDAHEQHEHQERHDSAERPRPLERSHVQVERPHITSAYSAPASSHASVYARPRGGALQAVGYGAVLSAAAIVGVIAAGVILAAAGVAFVAGKIVMGVVKGAGNLLKKGTEKLKQKAGHGGHGGHDAHGHGGDHGHGHH